MDKQFADEMIEKFRKKFFGYALTKTTDVPEAEELASRIVCEAYITLRSVEDIYNWEGYLYRIAANVYARYVKERKTNASEDIDGMEIGDSRDFVSDMIKEEELELLRREVAWLGKRHREIILLHYYHNKKINEIAEIMEIPPGTVKWHLADARTTIKKGIRKMRNQGNLGLEPIEFCDMGHAGSPGKNGDTRFHLNSRLRQNIAYAAYWEPRTVEEIARELGVSPVYVENEVAYLEEYGFLDLLPGQKYLTNIYITNLPQEVIDRCFEIDREVAKEVCRQYVPALKECFQNYREQSIFVPQDDYNYLLWSLVPLSVTWKIESAIRKEYPEECSLEGTHYQVKRKDGGDYIALAHVVRQETEPQEGHDDNNHFAFCGDMSRFRKTISSWSISTDFDTRTFGYEDNRVEDLEYLHLWIEGKLPKTEAVADKYIRLYQRGLLAQNGEKDQVNVVMVHKTMEEMEENWEFHDKLNNKLPKVPRELCSFIHKKCKEKVELQKPYYPAHMHKLVEYRNQAEVDRVMVLDELLEAGELKPLTEQQKKGVMQIVFSDILPQG